MATTKQQLTYKLEGSTKQAGSFKGFMQSSREFFAYIHGDGGKLLAAFVLVLLNSAAGVITPYLVARALDVYIAHGDVHGLAILLIWLGALYLMTVVVGYAQGILMGHVAQQTLFRLRDALFTKLQELPITFFNQNKAGDLMSRLNNDTDKLNQFLSESITRFVGSFFVIVGIAVFVLFINFKLGVVMLAATVFLLIITRILSPWIERNNKKNLEVVGSFTASLQENLNNFRVIIAYNKREYFRSHIGSLNEDNFTTGLKAGTANRIFEPIYDFAGNAALVVVLIYGLYLIAQGQLTLGLLVAFVSYTQKFYDPLRILATIFGNIQLSMAAWSRIRAILVMENNLQVIEAPSTTSPYRMEFKNVSFAYEDSDTIIENANLIFEAGKTYALVGPTGGGKSTTASLIARLYDPVKGQIVLNGSDIRSYSSVERAKLVSVILQDPILFAGTVADNIRYGNDHLKEVDDESLALLLKKKGFEEVLARFDQGLSTKVTQSSGSGLSVGQKQLISFMRALLREPELLILDEATANIDTITEGILNKTLASLPSTTTKVIIAHRLNTIKEADEIMFVNGRHVVRAGDFHEAIKLIEHSKRTS